MHCCHVYCSEKCRDRHWVSHWMLCLDHNMSQFASIKTLESDKGTCSDYAVAEVIAGLIYKSLIYIQNGIEPSEAV